jgi:PBSX family phage portal protein
MGVEGEQLPFAKAYVIGVEGGNASNVVLPETQELTAFSNVGAVRPPYHPDTLALVYENSSALRSNVDAYVTNIDSFGHRFEPVIDLDAADVDERIRAALRLERVEAKKNPANVTNEALLTAPDEPTDKEVAARKEELAVELRAERAFLENFFENCTSDMPFSGPEGLRGLTRMDVEVMGNGYWEVLRDGLGQVSQFVFMPGRTVRLMPVDSDPVNAPVELQVIVRTSALSTALAPMRKRFRRYVQTWDISSKLDNGTVAVYFKEFGDPRVMSAHTGEVFDSVEALLAKEPAAREATEVLHFKCSSPRSPYGIPRWIGALLPVLGTRQSEETNYLSFENQCVPPLAILVSGGRLTEETVTRIKDYVNTQLKGKQNRHKIMVLEAEGAENAGPDNAGKMKIQLVPLTQAQMQDATFQAYDERNADKVGQMFRLPRLLRGDVRDFNRSTAEASLDFAELQVFGPIREQFDWTMNKLILPALGVKYHHFRSKAPTVRDPDGLSKMIALLVTANVLTPEEARDLMSGVFNREFQRIKAPWTQMPIGLSLAGRGVEDNLLTPGDEAAEFGAAGGQSLPGSSNQAALQINPTQNVKAASPLERQARALLKLRTALAKMEASEALEEFAARKEVIRVPAPVWAEWTENAER